MAAATQIQRQRAQLQTAPATANHFGPEFALLVECCKPANQSDLSPLVTPELNWERVLESAQHHRVLPALCSALASQNLLPSTLRLRAHKHAWRILHFTLELTKIAGGFEQRGIQFLAHKGLALAQLLYGTPAMRQFGDLDLIVRARDIPLARIALMELGYEPGLQLSARQEKSFLRHGYEYVFGLKAEHNLAELQWQILPRFCSINFDVEALFSRSIQIELDGLALRTLGYNDLMLVLCVHAAKHDWFQLGMLRDIATLAKFDLDWGWITREARSLGILKILQVSLRAARELFESDLSPALQLNPALLCSVKSGAAEKVCAIVSALQRNQEPNTESIRYFRSQLRTRERLRDRVRFVWRLATTPSVEEWNAIQLPDRFFGLYRAVRIVRLARRFIAG